MAHAGANARHLVRCNIYANAAAADHDSPLGPAIEHRSADRFCVESFRRSIVAQVGRLSSGAERPRPTPITERGPSPVGDEPDAERFTRQPDGRISDSRRR